MLEPIPGYRRFLGAAPLAGVPMPGVMPAPPGPTVLRYGAGAVEPVIRYLTDDTLNSLLLLTTMRSDLQWPHWADLANARNAHSTNTPLEMAGALAGPYDWFEGDVRLGPSGELRMAHYAEEEGGMSYDEWLSIGIASGRGLKIDLKEVGTVIRAVEAAKRRGVPPHRFIINVTVLGETDANISLKQMKRIRQLYPDAVINISVSVPKYTPDVILKMQRWAKAAGGKVMFPLRWDAVDDNVIRQLRPYGRIAIWNQPDIHSPSDVALETARLRAMGVDGTIDLRKPSPVAKVTAPIFDALVATLGWTTAIDVLRTLDRSIQIFR
jgi:hypothetical protein